MQAQPPAATTGKADDDEGISITVLLATPLLAALPSPRAPLLLYNSHLHSQRQQFEAAALLLPQGRLPVVASLGLVMSFQSFDWRMTAC